EHLTAVADRGDPGTLVHVEADVPLLAQPRLAGVQPHPHANRSVGERALAVRRRGDRVRRAGERDEERVSLRVDLDTAVLGERRAKSPPMHLQRLGVVVAERVQQTRRALDVREEERHHTRRELAFHEVSLLARAISVSHSSTRRRAPIWPKSARARRSGRSARGSPMAARQRPWPSRAWASPMPSVNRSQRPAASAYRTAASAWSPPR